MAKILHLLDPSTPPDALDILAQVLTLPHEHYLAAVGHHSTAMVARNAGIDPGRITWLPSIGVLDPTAWRALKRLLLKVKPSRIHAWGASAALAAAMGASSPKFKIPIVASFADLPAHPRVLAFLGKGNITFTATDPAIADALPNNPLLIPPGIGHAQRSNAVQIRASLGISPTDFPVILAGADGKNARQDLAIWIAAILHQLFPQTRLILREDPRTLVVPGLDRYGFDLADERLVIAARHSLRWERLLPAADVLLIAATGAIPTASMLYAMAARVPIVATPIASVTELLTHNHNALIARHTGIGIAPPAGHNTIRPRTIAAELERLLTTAGLANFLTENAAEHVTANFPPSAMLTGFEELYQSFPNRPQLQTRSAPAAVHGQAN